MIFKTESGRVSKEILGIGSGSGTRWALPLIAVFGSLKGFSEETFVFLSRVHCGGLEVGGGGSR